VGEVVAGDGTVQVGVPGGGFAVAGEFDDGETPVNVVPPDATLAESAEGGSQVVELFPQGLFRVAKCQGDEPPRLGGMRCQGAGDTSSDLAGELRPAGGAEPELAGFRGDAESAGVEFPLDPRVGPALLEPRPLVEGEIEVVEDIEEGSAGGGARVEAETLLRGV